MAHIHGRDFIHRDLKPQNVLLNDSGINGNALICDLGTVKNMIPGAINFERTDNSHRQVNPEAPLNMTTRTGTPLYMAPEMHVSMSYTNAVDVWSYGVLLIRLFTLESPYPTGVTSVQLMKQVAKGELRPINVERSALPHPKLKDIIDGCLKYEASERLTFVNIEFMLSEILQEMEEERQSCESKRGSGGAGRSSRAANEEQKSNVDMTLTLTHSVGKKPGRRTWH